MTCLDALLLRDMLTSAGTTAVVGYTAEDQRFAVEGGLYSIAISPSGAIAAVSGAGKVISRWLACLVCQRPLQSRKVNQHLLVAHRQRALAPFLLLCKHQSDSVESLSFSSLPLTMLASGSVDGSICLFDVAHRFAVRRHIRDAHEGATAVKVEFYNNLPKRVHL